MTGDGVGFTGDGVGFTGDGVGVTGDGVGATGVTGRGVGETGVTGRGVGETGVTGDGVGFVGVVGVVGASSLLPSSVLPSSVSLLCTEKEQEQYKHKTRRGTNGGRTHVGVGTVQEASLQQQYLGATLVSTESGWRTNS